jgi:alpha-beta hydrolase superfamily lysophospholipase
MPDATENCRPVRLDLPCGEHLAGDYLPTAGAHPDFAVLWVHGFGSRRGGEKAVAVRHECGRRGWAFAAFDFRGHGESGGTMHGLRASRLLDELGAIRDYLAGHGHTRLGLIGSSMGGFAVSWLAKLNPAATIGLVLLAPALSFLERRHDSLTPEQLAEWKQTDRLRVKNDWVDTEIGYGLLEEQDRFRADDLIAAWATPTLIFHGLADDVVPAAESLSFLRVVGYPRVELRLFKDGDHRLTAYKEEIAAGAGRFFANLIGE